MSHLTAHSPATSVLKVRIWGDSGRGPVTSLPRGSLIATYLYFPTNFNPDYHSPILAGVPDGWSFGSKTKLKDFADQLLSTGVPTRNDARVSRRLEMAGVLGPKGESGEGLDDHSIRMQKTFVPLVLAEDVTVRKSSPNADWADTYVSAALSGVTELHGKWCSGAGCTSGPPGVMFQGGEEFWVYLDCNNNEGRQDCILSAHPAVAARRNCRESFRQICKPLGEFVHPPLRLSHDSRELISGVYIDPLTSKALRAGAGNLSYSYRTVINPPGIDGDAYVQRWRTAARVNALDTPEKNRQFIDWVVPRALAAVRDFGDNARFTAVKANLKNAAEELRDADETNINDVQTKAKALGDEALPARTTAEDGLTQTGPGFNKPPGNDLVLIDDAKVNINITESAREFYGRDFYAGTQSAEQKNALSGHGTALVPRR